jgi:hypothetical protein
MTESVEAKAISAISAIFEAMASGDNTKSTHPLAIAEDGMSGTSAVSGF